MKALIDVSDPGLRLYSAVQLAELWGCSRTHIYKLITGGELSTVQIGEGRSKMRVPAASALAYIERQAAAGRVAS